MTDLSKEYAAALFSLAREHGGEAEAAAALALLQEVLARTPGYVAFLASPAIPKEARLASLTHVLSPELPADVSALLALLCARGEAALLPPIIAAYEALYTASRNIARGTVTSAVPLTEAEQEKLRQALAQRSGHPVDLTYKLDPALLGGLTVELDGLRFDGSLRNRLNQLKEVMKDEPHSGGDQ